MGRATCFSLDRAQDLHMLDYTYEPGFKKDRYLRLKGRELDLALFQFLPHWNLELGGNGGAVEGKVPFFIKAYQVNVDQVWYLYPTFRANS